LKLMKLNQTEIENETYEVKINYADIEVSKLEIEFTLGYDENKIPQHFKDMIDEVLEQLPQNCDIKAGYRLLDVSKPTDKKTGLIVNNTFFSIDKIVTSQLKNSEQAAIFLCTIGPAMENWSSRLMREGDPTKSYFVNTIASVTVEAVTNVLHDFIGEQMRQRGLNITNRYSPGYCNWSVAEQHLLFSMLPKNFCGVTLTDTALMIPIKSISGIIGVGASVKRKDYLCDTCGVKDCTYRSKRRTRKKKLE